MDHEGSSINAGYSDYAQINDPPSSSPATQAREGHHHPHVATAHVPIPSTSSQHPIPHHDPGEEFMDLTPAPSPPRESSLSGGSNRPFTKSLTRSLDSLKMEESDWEFPGWGGIQSITTIAGLSPVPEAILLSRGTLDEMRKSSLEEIHQEREKEKEGSVVHVAGSEEKEYVGEEDYLLGPPKEGDVYSLTSPSSYGNEMPDDDDGDDDDEEEEEVEDFSDESKHKHTELGQLASTAIAGNDITSSCLYIISLTTLTSGKLAPFCILLVVILLYLFRSIYTEVVTALPLNGGAYNALLNTTSKFNASIAACLTLLSYTATAVVSAQSSMSYGAVLWCGSQSDSDTEDDRCTDITEYWGTIALLGLFALLNLIGLSESANVATVIFLIHMTTLSVLFGACVVFFIENPSQFADTWNALEFRYNPPVDFYYGFCSALLGISGFESAANFIEEQKPGVFSKTLRNMWIITGFFNFTLCLLAFATLPADQLVIPDINSTGIGDQPNSQLLAYMGQQAGGTWLSKMVSTDALFVLSGAVLTAYVGVLGLVRRMSLDRCLPQFLLVRNHLRDTNHFIIVGFFLVTSSLFILVRGDVTTIAGVYTIAFLGVMCFFSVAAMLLKFKRSKLPREAEAPWLYVFAAFILVFLGMIGNIIEEPANFLYFILYFSAALFVVLTMLSRTYLLKGLIYFIRFTPLRPYCETWLKKKVKEVRDIKVVFFAKDPDLKDLNKAILYARENELTSCLKVVHFLPDLAHTPIEWSEAIAVLDRMYPDIKIDLVLVEGTFCPEHVSQVSKSLGVPKNFMFMTCPSDSFQHNLASFGGVRIIVKGY